MDVLTFQCFLISYSFSTLLQVAQTSYSKSNILTASFLLYSQHREQGKPRTDSRARR